MPSASAQTVRDFRRAQIVAAARSIVAAQGLPALTFSSLETECTFTRGVISYHFKNKAEIVRAVFDDVVREIDASTYARVSPDSDLQTAVQAVMSGMIRGFASNHEATAVLISYWSRTPRIQGADVELFARYRRHAALLVRRAAGRNVEDVVVDALAGIMVALVIGAVLQLDISPHFVTVDALVEEAVATMYARLRDL